LRKLTPLTLSFLLLLSFPLLATTIRVPQDQPTIQAGINAAVHGDTVLVAPGTYSVNINFNGKNIALKSEVGAEETILTPASNNTSIMRVVSGEDTTATIDGFRFLRGSAINGGGILFNNSKGTVVNNIFDSCVAWGGNVGSGGGVACMGTLARVRISNNVFKNGLGGNGTGYADALYCSGATVEFFRNLVINNTSAAVILPVSQANIKIINNVIAHNPGGAISCASGTVVDVRNNIFFDNPFYGVHAYTPIALTIDYNDFVSSPLLDGARAGVGNLSVSPQFVGGTPFDYHLQAGSPCIDAGDPATEVPPFGGSRVDMGAFEFPKTFSLIIPRGNVPLRKPQFVWSRLRDSLGFVSASYQVVLASNCDFSIADSSPVLQDTVWKVPYLLNRNQNYCWKAIILPDTGGAINSDSIAFRVTNPALMPLLPVNNDTLGMRRPTFKWSGISDTSIPESFTYRVILSKDLSFATADTSPILVQATWKTTYSLDAGTPYYWKVIA